MTSVCATCFSSLHSTTYVRASASDITTLPVVGSNLIFQEVDYFDNFTIYSPYAVRKVYKFQTRKMMIVTF